MNSNKEIGIQQPAQPPIPPKGRVWIDEEEKKDKKKKEEERVCGRMDEHWTAIAAELRGLAMYGEG